jgi:microcystin-dependent protein
MFHDLFDVIGTTYGSGDGSTTFNLPDSNQAKRFLQGDTVAGTVKQAGLPNITGNLGSTGQYIAGSYPIDGAFGKTGATTNVPGSVGSTYYPIYATDFDASRASNIYGASDTVQPNALTTRYIIKAFDGQTPDSALIDITQYAQELATKANRQLSNLDTNNLSVHVVVDSYYDSTTGDWYRVYDDGWVEQGGLLPTNTDWNTLKTITLLKPMSESSWVITGTTANVTYTNGSFTIISQTSTTASVAYYCSSGKQACWVAYGQGASV